jgi:hypothetical protein
VVAGQRLLIDRRLHRSPRLPATTAMAPRRTRPPPRSASAATAQDWAAQPRPRALMLTFSNHATDTVNLIDSAAFQVFSVTAHGVRWVKLRVLPVYPGTSGHSVPITEAEFFSNSS